MAPKVSILVFTRLPPIIFWQHIFLYIIYQPNVFSGDLPHKNYKLPAPFNEPSDNTGVSFPMGKHSHINTQLNELK
jgi:hypothetical protein